jgi:parvulin-like peptidyl-prolyl isomerase
MNQRWLLVLCLCVACARGKPSQTARVAPPPAAQGELTLASGRSSDGEVERVFTLPRGPVGPKLGRDDAKVWLEVCSDFECPFCAQLAPTMHELVENYGELVRVGWRDCPLPFHKHAVPAAEAAREVFAQAGDAGFWAYHDALFAYQGELEAKALVELAKKIAGVDPEKVRLALADHRHQAAVESDLKGVFESGAASGGFGTPAIFVNGRLISGAQPYEVFEQAVERALIETPEAHADAKARSDVAYPMARARHILIQYRGARGADAQITRSKEEARALAAQLATRIVKEHADLARLAREHSDCPSAPEGGELGRFTRGELVPEFEDALFALTPGQISGVVETPFGFHIIQRQE